MLGVVLFATALFFAGMSTKLRDERQRFVVRRPSASCSTARQKSRPRTPIWPGVPRCQSWAVVRSARTTDGRPVCAACQAQHRSPWAASTQVPLRSIAGWRRHRAGIACGREIGVDMASGARTPPRAAGQPGADRRVLPPAERRRWRERRAVPRRPGHVDQGEALAANRLRSERRAGGATVKAWASHTA
jgi:hypothetical protein